MIASDDWLRWRGNTPIMTERLGLNNNPLVRITALHSIGLGSTIFRLFLRRARRKLWWDDYTAFVAFLFDCALVTSMWGWTPPDGIQFSQFHILSADSPKGKAGKIPRC